MSFESLIIMWLRMLSIYEKQTLRRSQKGGINEDRYMLKKNFYFPSEVPPRLAKPQKYNRKLIVKSNPTALGPHSFITITAY